MLSLRVATAFTGGDSVSAYRLWLASYERHAMLDEDSRVALLRLARRADPTFLPAELDLIRATADRLTFADRRREAARGISDPALARCLVAVAVQQQGGVVTDSLHAVVRTFGRSKCTDEMLADWRSRTAPHARERPLGLAAWRSTIGDLHWSWIVWASYSDALCNARDTASAIAALQQGTRELTEPVSHLHLQLALLHLVEAYGDSTQARALRARVDASVARDGRPGMRLEWLADRVQSAASQSIRDSISDEAISIARRYGARQLELDWLVSDGAPALDRGDVAHAVAVFRSATAVADAMGGAPRRSRVHARLGRALVKQGRVAEGIAELRLAMSLADPDDHYTLADVNHNLGHAYESAGNVDSSLRAIDRFAALAAPFDDDGIAVISLRDAGALRWNAGLHASAIVQFNRMVQLIDRRHEYYFYAGEYYERVGNLSRARHYYALVSAGNTEEGARALAGSVRVFEALGLADSAASAAKRHDAASATAEEIPLLPTVLVRSGHAEQGLATMRDWIARQAAQANTERMASATTHLAELSLEAGRYPDAAAEARRAVALSGSANVVEERGRALLVEGAALARANRADSAARLLSRAELQLRARVSTELGFEMNVTLGDALGACGQGTAALIAYDRAASMSEHMRASFDDDLDQARVHAEKLAPFDGALRVLLSAADRPNVELVARWSQRRKEAPFVGGHTTQPLSVAELQHRLGTHDALIDYVMLDAQVAAVVITPTHAQVIVLPATAAGLSERVTALRRPYAAYNGRVDAARLSFDARNAAALYVSLIQPIEAALRGASRLIVVPDGALHLLPFDALVTTGGAHPTFLVDRYEISYLPSAEFLGGAPRQKLSAGSLLFVGYGVEGDTVEWKNVSAAWSGPSQPLLGADASEARVASSAPRFDILHFAVHARANVADPLASNLLLAASGGRDGIFQASEIAHVRMTPALVVLSACETDAGVVLRGTGAMGLARAFLVAGARGVVGTEWSVGPATTRAMTVFYQSLAAGSTPGAALRSAKLALRGDPATANPFYWAPFTLVVR